MKKALIIANMLFASATVFGMETNGENSKLQLGNRRVIRKDVERTDKIKPTIKIKNRLIDDLVEAIKTNDFEGVKWAISYFPDISRFVNFLSVRSTKMDDKMIEKHLNDIYKSRGAASFVNKKNRAGTTLLITAVLNNNEEIVKYLIDYGADVNIEGKYCVDSKYWDSWGQRSEYARQGTPLVAAILNGNEKIVKYLIDHGADINIEGVCYVSNCVNYNQPTGRKSLRGTPLLASMVNGSEEIIKYLIDHGADVNMEGAYYVGTKCCLGEFLWMEGSKRGTPLIAALRNGRAEIAQHLIKHGADINKENQDGETPLFSALDSRANIIAKYLIHNGTDINKENQYGETPLFPAIRHNSEDEVELLVEYGADTNKENQYGETPLSTAAFFGNENIVQCLVEYYADVNKVNGRGKTPLSIAIESKHHNVIKYLQQHGAVEN